MTNYVERNGTIGGRHGSVVAVIPARGGSKGIPRKNLQLVGGQSLVSRAVRTALGSANVEEVFVSTDDDEIAVHARRSGARIIRRPAEHATDTASSESVLLHALDYLKTLEIHPDVLVFIQATSPFIDGPTLDRAIGRVRDGAADVVFSAVESHSFLWVNRGESLVGVNHDLRARPRRQDRAPEYRETGAFYVMNVSGFSAAQHRFFGVIGCELVDQASAIDIDSPADLQMSEALATVRTSRQTIRNVQAVVTDFDGVHTDDHVFVDANGLETVRVSRADGLGVSILREMGVPFLILSKERNPVVLRRAEKLRAEVLQSVDDKLSALREWCDDRDVDLSDVVYVGNDVNDLAAMRAVGYPVAVADSHPEVLRAASVVLSERGGEGAIRAVADLIKESHSQKGEIK